MAYECSILQIGYTFFIQGDDPRFDKNMEYHKRFTHNWDEPEIDEHLDCRKR